MSARGTNSDFDQQIYNVHENSLKTHQSRIQVDAALRQMRPWFMLPCIMRPYVNPALYQMDVPAVRYV